MSERSDLRRSNGGSSPRSRSTGQGADRSSREDSKTTRQSRRTVLRGLAATGVAGIGLLSSTGASTAIHDRYADEYETVVDVVDAGADDTGEESITPVLEEQRADDTLLVFPEGRYYMDEQFRFTGFENFGVVGDGATLVPADFHAFDGPQYRLFRLGVSYAPGGRIRFEGFDVDQTAPDTGIRTIEATASQRLEVRDIEIRGEHDSGTWGPGMFALSDSDGRGIVERFRAPDGGVHVDETPNAGNMWRGPIGIEANTNEGHLEFVDCELGGFPDNGLYAANDRGTVVVDGGRFENSNGANVRLGGEGSVIRNATISVDRTRSYDNSQRGLRLENGNELHVEDVDISITAPQPTSHAISVMNSSQRSRIEDVTIEIRGDAVNHGIVVSPDAGYTWIDGGEIVHETAGGYPLWIKESDRQERALVELLDISGEAGVSSAGFRDGIRCGRDNCRFSHVTVDQPGRDGADRNGLVLTGDDATLYRCTLRASQYPYVDQGDGNHLRNSEAESYRDGLEGVRLYPGIEGPEFRVNRIVDGIDDLGATDVLTWRNTYE
ncbi:right-handed parallel beta-helix repeat-containing protein [Natronolimnohabitans sp. A-GB9]|uniref:right-handed parallel beta-helix repeat-containing protein n=1 Tax=Natronolimnohabitans sp. A-GB9 TaxID=3069757 RepID=UPI0027B03A23|nr:right-handed parallel beta-helix repeat-containing protein [Natronolimnohabitans sp. A-GB9]MDQ2051495.1 right-handed parallel beta-helix repeat-containing protein [Natronolimnohabitans sp. A-GB9]